MYIHVPLSAVARGHFPPHCENNLVLREAITEDDEDDNDEVLQNEPGQTICVGTQDGGTWSSTTLSARWYV